MAGNGFCVDLAVPNRITESVEGIVKGMGAVRFVKLHIPFTWSNATGAVVGNLVGYNVGDWVLGTNVGDGVVGGFVKVGDEVRSSVGLVLGIIVYRGLELGWNVGIDVGLKVGYRELGNAVGV